MPKSFYLSGGSTGEPAKFPRHKNEGIVRYANSVLTRSWLGLSQGDSYIHLWGHAHLFGEGSLVVIRKLIRKSKDWLVGGYRLNVYNQSPKDIRAWVHAIERVRPKFIVGYSSALVNLASEIENTQGKLHIANLEWIICTAETVAPADIEMLERVFGVSVAIEYGAIETGLIAQTRPTLGQRLQLLWGSLAGNADESGRLRLSTLDRRAFPLINYEIGDRVSEVDNPEHVLSLGSVLGRTGDQVSLRMRDDSIGQISMVGIVGALKNVPGVRTVQAAQTEIDAIEVYLTGDYGYDNLFMNRLFLQEMARVGVYISPTAVSFKRMQEPIKSIAGKINRVIPNTNS